MPIATTQFSTELLGYDNDTMPGIVAENVWSDLNMLSCFLSQQAMSHNNLKAFKEVSNKTQTIVNSISFYFADTGVVLPTIKHEFFAEPEEKEYKVQTVTITFDSEVPSQDVKEFLLNSLDIINEGIETTKVSNETWHEATLWHKETEKKIISSMIKTFKEIV